jgi:hypothetical protein
MVCVYTVLLLLVCILRSPIEVRLTSVRIDETVDVTCLNVVVNPRCPPAGERIITVVDNTRIKQLEKELQHSKREALSCGSQLNSTTSALVAAKNVRQEEQEAKEAAIKKLAQEQAEIKSLRQQLAATRQALREEIARVRNIQAAAGALCTQVSRS